MTDRESIRTHKDLHDPGSKHEEAQQTVGE